MASVLFVTWDGSGNVPPALGIAAELRDHGERVRFLGHEQQGPAIEGARFRFEPYRHARPWSPAEAAYGHGAELTVFEVFTDPGIGEDLLASVKREPAYLVVADCLLLALWPPPTAPDCAARCSCTPSTSTLRAAGAADPYAGSPRTGGSIRPGSGRPPTSCSWRPRRSSTPARASPHERCPRTPAIPAPWCASPIRRRGRRRRDPAGPGQPEHHPLPRPDRRPAGDPRRARRSPRYGSGHHRPGRRSRAAQRAGQLRTAQVVPHNDVLPGVSLVIGHGSHATTMRALAWGRPLLIVPMHPMLDQPMIGQAARRVPAKPCPPPRRPPASGKPPRGCSPTDRTAPPRGGCATASARRRRGTAATRLQELLSPAYQQ